MPVFVRLYLLALRQAGGLSMVYPTSYTVVAVRGPSLPKILNCISGRKLMGWMDGLNKVSRNCFPRLKYICKKYYGNLFNNCTTLVFAKVVD